MTKTERFAKALRILSETHFRDPDGTGACIPSSLAVRDFLRELGFAAEVRSVALNMILIKPGTLPRQIMIGSREIVGASAGRGWNGHLVVTSNGLLIDPTFIRLRRPWWPWLPAVAIVPVTDRKFRERVAVEGGKSIPVIACLRDNRDGEFLTMWAETRRNDEWKSAPAARPDRREGTVSWLI